MDDQDDQLALLRSAMRKDLASVGVTPTGTGIQLIAQQDAVLGFALLCEAVYVQLYHGRPPEAILAYLAGPLLVHDPVMRQYILGSVLRVRRALSAAAGHAELAQRVLLGDARAEPAVIAALIAVCRRTAREFAIPWSADYFPDYGHSPRRGYSCALVIAVGAVAALYGLYRLVRLITG